MTDTPPHVKAWLAETTAKPLPTTPDNPDRLRARAVMAALNAAVDHPDLNVWRDPAGDVVGPVGVLAAVAADALRGCPSAAEVVSASRVLLNALLYQPGQTADVVEARRLVEKAIDRYDRNQPGDAVTATHTFPEQVQDFRSRFSRLLHASTVNGVFSCDIAGDINKIAAIAALVADEEFFDGIRRPPRNARS